MPTRSFPGSRVPLFLSFDAEPDGFQAPRDDGWRGLAFHVEWANRLRERLGSESGRDPRFVWMFRMDPQITELYGTPHHAVVRFESGLHDLADRGDVFGLHVHPLRRRDSDGLWIHDFADRAWNEACIESAADAFADAFGSRPTRYRHGAGYLDNDVVGTLDRLDFEVDLSLEPVSGWGLTAARVDTGIDSSPSVGAYVDCAGAPRHAYRPRADDFRIPADDDGRPLVMIPLTASSLLPEKPLWWRALRTLKTPPSRQRARMLYPSHRWPSTTFFWDLVADHLATMESPYLSFAVRTEAPETETARSVCALFDALPSHPLARRLDVVDPLEVASSLT